MLNKAKFFAHLLMFNKFTCLLNPLIVFIIIFGIYNLSDLSYCDSLTNTPQIPEAYRPLTRHEVQAVFDYQQEQIDLLKRQIRFLQSDNTLNFIFLLGSTLFIAGLFIMIDIRK